jgi:hypothetical protein
VQSARLIGPEFEPIRGGSVVQIRLGNGIRDKLGRRGETTVLVQKAVNRGGGHRRPRPIVQD